MNREIKFRAWDRTTKEMIDSDTWYFSDQFEPFVDAVENARQRHNIMQFTGLTDKNGKEIYEGDVVTWHNRYFELNNPEQEFIGQVKYDNGHYSLYTLSGDWDNSDWVGAITKVEVIGNIYENPELLERQN